MKYVFDIDGTICTNTDGEYQKAEPYPDRIKKINKLYDSGNIIIFLTARGMGRSDNSIVYSVASFKELTKNQLEEWGVKYHDLFLGKPSGDIYIDDKGVSDESFFTN